MAAGAADPERVPSRLVCRRSHCWAGADYDASACRNRLCAGFGGPRNLWAVCYDRTLARLCTLWSQPHFGAGAGFVSRPRDSRGCAPSLGWRSRACGSRREHDGDGVGSGVHLHRYVAPRIRHGASFQADPLRLHERHRAHGADQPVTEALRFLDQKRRSTTRSCEHRQRHPRRTGELDRIRSRCRHTRGDPFAQALQAHPGPSARSRRGDYRGRCNEPRR